MASASGKPRANTRSRTSRTAPVRKLQPNSQYGVCIMRDPEQLLIGRSMLRRRRMRRLLLAKLLRERHRSEHDDEQIGGADDEEGGDEEHRLLKLLIARGLLRRARIRRLLLAHLVREHRGASDEYEDDD